MNIKIEKDIALSNLTTFKIGGLAKFFVSVKSTQELKESILYAKGNKIPFFVIGGGSNTLFSDFGFDGLVIKMEINGIEWNKTEHGYEVIASAGEEWDSFVSLSVSKEMFGLENLSGIPGTVGASPVQNIGAYGVEVRQYIKWVEVLDITDLSVKIIKNEECSFDYRQSIFKNPAGKNFIIIRVCFTLNKENEPNLSYKDIHTYFLEKGITNPSLFEIREAVLNIRIIKLPDIKTLGSAGSFFKNPKVNKETYCELIEKFPGLPCFESNKGNVKVSLAWILDKICGLKGYRENNCGLYEKQPLIVVNYGNAKAFEIKKMSEKILKEIKNKTGIVAELEVNLVGNF